MFSHEKRSSRYNQNVIIKLSFSISSYQRSGRFWIAKWHKKRFFCSKTLFRKRVQVKIDLRSWSSSGFTQHILEVGNNFFAQFSGLISEFIELVESITDVLLAECVFDSSLMVGLKQKFIILNLLTSLKIGNKKSLPWLNRGYLWSWPLEPWWAVGGYFLIKNLRKL